MNQLQSARSPWLRFTATAVLCLGLTACADPKASEGSQSAQAFPGYECVDDPDEAGAIVCKIDASYKNNCTYLNISGGVHEFLNGQVQLADAYDCGVITGMRCHYFESSTQKEMVCL